MRGSNAPHGPTDEDARRLTVELEAALLRELCASFDELNQSYFKRALRPPEIRISDSAHRLGQWDSSRRCIEMARSLFLKESWGTVLEVLKHEMAHQYVHEILGRVDEPSHGPAFREICEKLGIDARAAGVPAGASKQAEGRREQHVKVLERIAQLLALAQSSNVHEAQAATSLAQKLMLKYNVESAALGTRGGYEFRHLGVPSGRVSESERLLSIILGQHFFVEVIWVPVYRPLEKKRGHVLEICGTRPNLEMASYVHAFLLRSAEHLWTEHKRLHDIKSNRDRRTYLAGVMDGFREKLQAETKQHREQGLVWVGDADLSKYFRRRHPHIRHTRTAGPSRNAAHGAGRSAGRRLVLHRGMHDASGASAGAKLLPARRR
jgi:predicted SprT family Zn-dependent metalloprotease